MAAAFICSSWFSGRTCGYQYLQSPCTVQQRGATLLTFVKLFIIKWRTVSSRLVKFKGTMHKLVYFAELLKIAAASTPIPMVNTWLFSTELMQWLILSQLWWPCKFRYIYSSSFVLKLQPLARHSPDNGMRRIMFTVACCMCAFQHDTSDFSRPPLSSKLFVWDDPRV